MSNAHQCYPHEDGIQEIEIPTLAEGKTDLPGGGKISPEIESDVKDIREEIQPITDVDVIDYEDEHKVIRGRD